MAAFVSKLRRRLNDSKYGERINNSTPGLLFEASYRAMSDLAGAVIYGTKLGYGYTKRLKSPVISKAYISAIDMERQYDLTHSKQPENLHSNRSLLYTIVEEEGRNVVHRRSLREALDLKYNTEKASERVSSTSARALDDIL